jgi:hypothetical protein
MLDVMFIKCYEKVAHVSLLPQIVIAAWWLSLKTKGQRVTALGTWTVLAMFRGEFGRALAGHRRCAGATMFDVRKPGVRRPWRGGVINVM